MASGMARSRWAFNFSCRALFEGSTHCYLWTFTFAEPQLQADARLAMKRWDSFRHWLRLNGKRGVRVIEQGEETGKWHFHVATRDRWDAKELWEITSRYGFGRIDVRERPVETWRYLMKYIGKAGTCLPKGMRRWASFGFKAVPCTAITKREKVSLSWETYYVDGEVPTFREWRMPDNSLLWRKHVRLTAEGKEQTKMTKYNEAQVSEIVGAATKQYVAVAEYRQLAVRKITMGVKGNPQLKETRIIVEHRVEIGGEPATVNEWLPPGASEEVKPPCSKGDLCLCIAVSMRAFKDEVSVTGTVLPLSSLNIAPAIKK